VNPTPSPSPLLVELVGQAGPPWWGVPVLAGIFLLLGGFLGFLFNRINEDRKAKREHKARWHDQVRVLSSKAITSARAIYQASVDKTNATEVPDPDDQPAADDKYAKANAKGWAELDVLLELQGDVSLVAPASISAALLDVIEASHNLLASTHNQMDESREAMRPTITALAEATREYLDVEDEVKK